MVNGIFDMMDEAMSKALGVDVETYITVIEDLCTIEEAEFIFNSIWFEENEEAAKKLFTSKLK